MLMDFSATANPNFFEACKDALYGMHTHLKEIFDTLWDDHAIWQHMAACPMFGRNNNGRRFTLEHQMQLNDFCKQQNMTLMSGWDMSRDKKDRFKYPKSFLACANGWDVAVCAALLPRSGECAHASR